MPASELQAMTKHFIAIKTIPKLPGGSDLRAPIVVYAEKNTDRAALLAFKNLRSWGYKNTRVLFGGLNQWQSGPICS